MSYNDMYIDQTRVSVLKRNSKWGKTINKLIVIMKRVSSQYCD